MKWISILIWLLFWTAMLFSQSGPTPTETFKDGYSAFQQGDYQNAIKNYTDAIHMDPNRQYFYYNRAMAYVAQGNPELAVLDFRHANDLKPTAEAYGQLGLIEYHKGNLKEAQADFENARSLKEDIGEMNFYLGLIYFKNESFEDGLKCFTAYTDVYKTNPEAYYYRGFCEAKLGQYEQALVSLKFATVYKLGDWRYYMKMYDVYTALHDDQRALNNISMVIELGQRKPEFYSIRAKLYHAVGEETLAEEDLQMV
ncbi:MAG TPA: tetratricopeptide repeat protein, partial [Chitinophagales bacterium]|nr:tetratricopeptide repeat protein [Chitinophagales bacterium]